MPSWLKPKNQVHLPDDSKPSIVFNEATGRWENQAEGEEDTCAPAAPPPMLAAPSAAPGAAPPAMNFRAGLVGKKRSGYVATPGITPAPLALAPALPGGAPPPGPALLDPSTPPAPQGGPTSLDYGGGGEGAPPPMMMFNPSAMGGTIQPPGS